MICISMSRDKKKQRCNKRALDIFANFTNTTTFFRLNDSNIVVNTVMVRPIILKPFLWIQILVLGLNSFELHGRKHLNSVNFRILGLATAILDAILNI